MNVRMYEYTLSLFALDDPVRTNLDRSRLISPTGIQIGEREKEKKERLELSENLTLLHLKCKFKPLKCFRFVFTKKLYF